MLITHRAALSRSAGAEGSFEVESEAYFAAMDVQPDTTRKTKINDLVLGLKSGGYWDKLDCLILLAAHDDQAARVDLRKPSRVATEVGVPTFTADRGYAGGGGSKAINTGYNPTTESGAKYLLNACHVGIFSRGVSGSGQADCGVNETRILTRNTSNQFTARLNSSTATVEAVTGVTDGSGHFLVIRGNSLQFRMVQAHSNDQSLRDENSTAVPNANFWVCGYNFGTPVYSARQIAIFHAGGYMTHDEAFALYDLFATYLIALGAWS